MTDTTMVVTKNLLCGGIAGTAACIIGQPLDLIKIRLQTNPTKFTSAYSCFLYTLRNEGFQSFYRGMGAPLCSQFFQTGLMFTGESIALRYLQPHLDFSKAETTKTSVNIFLAGSFGGLVKCIVLVPTDLIKCKMQVDQPKAGKAQLYSGPLDCFSKTYQKEGIRGIYKGFGVTTLREVPAFGLYFFVYRSSLNLLDSLSNGFNRPISMKAQNSEKCTGKPGITTIIAGGLAGSVAWICIYPFDVIKSHIQVSGTLCCPASGEQISQTIYTTAVGLYRLDGMRAFTRGLGVTIARAFPVNGAMLFTHESLKYTMSA